jgi:hypothetical protein
MRPVDNEVGPFLADTIFAALHLIRLEGEGVRFAADSLMVEGVWSEPVSEVEIAGATQKLGFRSVLDDPSRVRRCFAPNSSETGLPVRGGRRRYGILFPLTRAYARARPATTTRPLQADPGSYELVSK